MSRNSPPTRATFSGVIAGAGQRRSILQFPDLLGDLISLKLQRDKTLAHRRVLGLHQALLDQFEEPGDPCHRRRVVTAKLRELRLGAFRLSRG